MLMDKKEIEALLAIQEQKQKELIAANRAQANKILLALLDNFNNQSTITHITTGTRNG